MLFVPSALARLQEAAFQALAAGSGGAAGLAAASSLADPSALAAEAVRAERLLRAAWLLGLTVAALGSNYARLLLRLLYGAKWAAAPLAAATLRAFCGLVLLLALNGTAEAFAHAVMSPAELASANRALLLCALGQAAASFALEPRLGPPGGCFLHTQV